MHWEAGRFQPAPLHSNDSTDALSIQLHHSHSRREVDRTPQPAIVTAELLQQRQAAAPLPGDQSQISQNDDSPSIESHYVSQSDDSPSVQSYYSAFLPSDDLPSSRSPRVMSHKLYSLSRHRHRHSKHHNKCSDKHYRRHVSPHRDEDLPATNDVRFRRNATDLEIVDESTAEISNNNTIRHESLSENPQEDSDSDDYVYKSDVIRNFLNSDQKYKVAIGAGDTSDEGNLLNRIDDENDLHYSEGFSPVYGLEFDATNKFNPRDFGVVTSSSLISSDSELTSDAVAQPTVAALGLVDQDMAEWFSGSQLDTNQFQPNSDNVQEEPFSTTIGSFKQGYPVKDHIDSGINIKNDDHSSRHNPFIPLSVYLYEKHKTPKYDAMLYPHQHSWWWWHHIHHHNHHSPTHHSHHYNHPHHRRTFSNDYSPHDNNDHRFRRSHIFHGPPVTQDYFEVGHSTAHDVNPFLNYNGGKLFNDFPFYEEAQRHIQIDYQSVQKQPVQFQTEHYQNQFQPVLPYPEVDLFPTSPEALPGPPQPLAVLEAIQVPPSPEVLHVPPSPEALNVSPDPEGIHVPPSPESLHVLPARLRRAALRPSETEGSGDPSATSASLHRQEENLQSRPLQHPLLQRASMATVVMPGGNGDALWVFGGYMFAPGLPFLVKYELEG